MLGNSQKEQPLFILDDIGSSYISIMIWPHGGRDWKWPMNIYPLRLTFRSPDFGWVHAGHNEDHILPVSLCIQMKPCDEVLTNEYKEEMSLCGGSLTMFTLSSSWSMEIKLPSSAVGWRQPLKEAAWGFESHRTILPARDCGEIIFILLI